MRAQLVRARSRREKAPRRQVSAERTRLAVAFLLQRTPPLRCRCSWRVALRLTLTDTESCRARSGVFVFLQNVPACSEGLGLR